MSLITCGSLHEGHEWFSDYPLGRQEIFMCLAVPLCEHFCRFANEGAKISIKSYFMKSFHFCLSVFITAAWLSCHQHRGLRHFDSGMHRNQNFWAGK